MSVHYILKRGKLSRVGGQYRLLSQRASIIRDVTVGTARLLDEAETRSSDKVGCTRSNLSVFSSGLEWVYELRDRSGLFSFFLQAV